QARLEHREEDKGEHHADGDEAESSQRGAAGAVRRGLLPLLHQREGKPPAERRQGQHEGGVSGRSRVGGGQGSVLHVFSRTWARGRPRTLLPRRRRQPTMFIRQPASVVTTTSAPLFSMKPALSWTIAPLIWGKRTANDPPKPQHSSPRSR